MFLTRPPLAPFPLAKKKSSFDLHVLGTPPAFILSQDQTRHPIVYTAPSSQRVCLPVLVRRSRSLPRSLKRVGDSKRRSCDPGQAACYFVNTWLFADCVPAPPSSQRGTETKIDRNCLLVCVSQCMCVSAKMIALARITQAAVAVCSAFHSSIVQVQHAGEASPEARR